MRIALTGMKGVGKTTLGRLLADKLSLPFYDTDEECEKLHGKTCRELFIELGEVAFRKLESDVMRTLSTLEKGVVALGGGSLLDPENIKLLVPAFRLLLLEEEKDVIRARIKKAAALVGADFEGFYARRMAHYATLPAKRVRFSSQELEARVQEMMDMLHGK